MLVEAVGALQRIIVPEEVVHRAHGSRQGNVVVADMVVVVVFLGTLRVAVDEVLHGRGLAGLLGGLGSRGAALLRRGVGVYGGGALHRAI